MLTKIKIMSLKDTICNTSCTEIPCKQKLSPIFFMYHSGTQVFFLPWGNSDSVGFTLHIEKVSENGIFSNFYRKCKKDNTMLQIIGKKS